MKTSSFVNLPEYPLLRSSKRTRFEVDQKTHSVDTMHRKITEDLLRFIKEHFAKKPAVYIHGPQGVGKSYSLFEIVCLLRADPSNRVIYIPDCGAWGNTSGMISFEYLVDAVSIAFPEDKEVLDLCERIPLVENDLAKFIYEWIPLFCKSNKLSLYGVFDQHNGLTPQQRQIFPFKIIEQDLPSSLYWKTGLVIISASANNEYHLKVASDNQWPEFIINQGFDEEEFKAWINKNNFFIGQDMERVEYWTSRIPNELRLLLEAKNTLPAMADLQQVLDSYITKRENTIRAQHRVFCENHIKTESERKAAIHAVTLMMLDLDTSGQDFKLNQQLMYVDETTKHIRPTTPLARKMLISAWGLELQTALDVTTQTVFSSNEFTNDAKGRVLEKYIIRQLEKHKFFDFKALKVTGNDSSQWTSVQLSFKNFISYHFNGNTSPPGSVNWNVPTLFVPDQSNYPDVDLLIWDPAQRLLVPIQITILNPVSKHINNFFTQRDSGKRSELWKSKSGNRIQNIWFLWIGTNNDVSYNKDFDQFTATLADLDQACFPLLKCFQLN